MIIIQLYMFSKHAEFALAPMDKQDPLRLQFLPAKNQRPANRKIARTSSRLDGYGQFITHVLSIIICI